MELSVDRANKTLVKAQREEKQAKEDRDAQHSEDTRAQAEVIRAQAAEQEIRTQIEGVRRERASLDAQVRITDQTNEPAMRRLGAERYSLDTRLLALEGAADRAKDQLGKAEAKASAARDALRAAEEALQKARAHVTDCEHDAQEARLIAAGEPLPKYLEERRAWRQRLEEEDHQREVRYTWAEVDRLWATQVPPTYSRDEFERRKGLLFDLVRAAKPGEPKADEVRRVVCERNYPGEPKARASPLESGEQRWASRQDSAPAPLAVELARPNTRIIGGTEASWDPFSEVEQ